MAKKAILPEKVVILKHAVGYWLVPFSVPSWCSSCQPSREMLLIESIEKPTIKEIKKELNKLGYEIND